MGKRKGGEGRRVAALLGSLVLVWGCSDAGKQAGLSQAGGGTAVSDAAGDSGQDSASDGGTASGPGYLPLNPALSGHWMRRDIGNCIDLETWLTFQVPDGFVHTEVDRNACMAHEVRKTAGVLAILPNQLLQYTWHTKQAKLPEWQQRKVTTALVEELPPGVGENAEPAYKPGKRGLTTLAWVRAQDGEPFKRLDTLERVSELPKPTHTEQVASVQVLVTPPPDNAKPGEACTMAVTLSVSWDPGPTEPDTQATEQLTLPCHYGKDATSGWLRVAADGYEQSDSDGSWSKLFESKGIWKKYSGFVGHLLFDSFRPVLHQPPGQRNLFLSLASHGWYREFLNDPPLTVK